MFGDRYVAPPVGPQVECWAAQEERDRSARSGTSLSAVRRPDGGTMTGRIEANLRCP